MPKLDGFGVLEYMRSNGILETIPVSIISGVVNKSLQFLFVSKIS